MSPPIDRDVARLGIILEIADRIYSEIDSLTKADFVDSRNHIDLTAFRLGSIGEYVNKLSPELKARHPQIEWRRVYDMRNALFHDYEGIVGELLWNATGRPLADLVAVCRTELDAKTT